MATVKELLTNVANNTRKFLGTEEGLSLEEMSQGIGEASAESDFQTELIEEFSTILDRSVTPDAYANGREDGFADALEKLTDLVATANGEYKPSEGSTGFKSVSVNVGGENKLAQYFDKTLTELVEEDFGNATRIADNTFLSFKSLVSVTTPSSINAIGKYALSSCTVLANVTIPEVKTLENYAFGYCSALTDVCFPKVTSIGIGAFQYCAGITNAIFPEATNIGEQAFTDNKKLTSVDFPKATKIGSGAFYNGYSLKTVILRSETVCTLEHTSAFKYCYHFLGTKHTAYNPNGDKDGYIYVPRALLSDDDATKDYRRATNWATYSTQFRALEDYTVDGTINGALDPNKI